MGSEGGLTFSSLRVNLGSPTRLAKGSHSSHSFQEIEKRSVESGESHPGHSWCCLHQEWQDRQVWILAKNKTFFRFLMISKNKPKPETQEGSFQPPVAPMVVTSDANYYHLAAWKVPETLLKDWQVSDLFYWRIKSRGEFLAKSSNPMFFLVRGQSQ